MSWLSNALSGKKEQTTQSQSQYRPDPQAYAAMLQALRQGQAVSQTPFSTPQAPVAGFSPDQARAFGLINQAQGSAAPYYQQAANYFSPQGAQQFFNPMSDAVMANMKDIFGAQMKQTTGNAIAQAGGAGAGRIGVVQANLAKQQSLAAGQTMSDMYARAQQAAQNAGIGMGQTGNAFQNSALQGANALLGTGSLQQMLEQQREMAPYNQTLQQIQWPYQNAAFNAQITGGLAPQMGGITNSSGTNVQTNPGGVLGNAMGLGMTAMGAFGGMPGMNGMNPMGGMTGNYFPGNPAAAGAGVGYGANGPNFYPQFAVGGPVGPKTWDDHMGEAATHAGEMIAHYTRRKHARALADGGDVGPFEDRFGEWGRINELYGRKVNPAFETWAPASDIDAAAPPLPRSRPASADEPLQGEVLPPDARPAMGEHIYSNPALARREPGFIDSPWAALMAGGLGILKANGNIGGASEGLEHLKGNREAAWKDISADQAASKLMEDARRHAAEFAQKERFHTDTLNAPKVMAPGASLVRPNTGETIHTAGSTLTDGAAEVAGRRLADGDAGALAGWGRGAQGAENIARINNKAVELLTTERGMSPSEAAAHISRVTQEYKARGVGASTEARVGAGREANLAIILKAAEAAVPAAIEASEALPRSNFVPLNRLVQAGQVMTSDPALKRFGMANLQLAEHWARAMNPTGVMRESDRDYALKFLGTADSKETYRAAVDQLMKQIQVEKKAVSSFRNEPGASAPSGDPLTAARAAIAKGAPRDAVIKRLRDNGIDASGL